MSPTIVHKMVIKIKSNKIKCDQNGAMGRFNCFAAISYFDDCVHRILDLIMSECPFGGENKHEISTV